eukprot:SM000002S05742  [mRNA]  locus=s2:1970688:1971705:- [translate_table: standard]
MAAAQDGADALRVLPIHRFLGLRLTKATKDELVARMRVTDASRQPYNQLHGGVSALIAESLASIGGGLTGNGPALGLEVNCSHVRAVAVGESIVAKAVPVHQGRTIQVWEVRLWKDLGNDETDQPGSLVAIARVTLGTGLGRQRSLTPGQEVQPPPQARL